ncbi:MAG: sulfotransferase [Luminiphilus sp.]|nr:sulfotransferase [Luminiphilus sp.]
MRFQTPADKISRTTMATDSSRTISQAVARIREVLKDDPDAAVNEAVRCLEQSPNHLELLFLKGVAQYRLGDFQQALIAFEQVLKSNDTIADAHLQLALSQASLELIRPAIASLRRVIALEPLHRTAWRLLGEMLLLEGDFDAASEAQLRHIEASASNPKLREAGAAMIRNDIPRAERLLKSHLKAVPTDVAAMRMLAEVAVRVGRDSDAEKLLRRCLSLAPKFSGARYNYAVLMHRMNKPAEALAEVEALLLEDPEKPSYRNLIGVILSRIGEYERSSDYYKSLVSDYSDNPKIWLSYAHVLKTEGKRSECETAYRRAISLQPNFGEAYWSLANLKTFRFDEDDINTMRQSVLDAGTELNSRVQFHFALGKAAEDAKDHEQSFEQYRQGNELHASTLNYSAEKNTRRMLRMKSSFTREFFDERAFMGCPDPSPIFIVGMPRAGSTLLEQILSSHSKVEGTTELPDIVTLARELRERSDEKEIGSYDNVLASLNASELAKLGETYLARTKIHRKTEKPFFIDKMPNNFLHIALIAVTLPNAKIIDARRHPMACCFSNFKQYFAQGQSFSYSLSDMGSFYRDYVELMAHYDQCLPGQVHRVIYEEMVADTERQVRRMLDHCGLDFEPQCLRFFENDRPVRTASSEQVRQPIYSDAIAQWKPFEAHLNPLKEALGSVLKTYPSAPSFDP